MKLSDGDAWDGLGMDEEALEAKVVSHLLQALFKALPHTGSLRLRGRMKHWKPTGCLASPHGGIAWQKGTARLRYRHDRRSMTRSLQH